MLDIISFGDSTLDVFLDLREEDAQAKCFIQEETCKVCLDYAEKIPVSGITRVVGAGNASNNAVGSARLGLKSSIVSILGADEVGSMTVDYWKKQGVNVKHVTIDKKRGTNYSTVLNYSGERSILVFHERRNYRFPKALAKAKWVYYTSLGAGSETMHKGLLSYLKKTGAKLCFQPGTHQLKLGKEALKPLIAASEITVMNKEEAERILALPARSKMEDLLIGIHKLGCRIALLTDGNSGAYTFDGSEMMHIGIMDVPVVERTGCGDAFATGVVAALAQGKPMCDALRWGTANSASVLSFIGPQKGLMTAAQMKRFLSRFPDIHATAYGNGTPTPPAAHME